MSTKLIIIIAAVFLLMMGMMGAGFFILWSKMGAAPQPVISEQEQAANAEPEDTLGPLFSLRTFIVNLADKGGKRYLRITMDLELTNEEIKEKLEKRLPQIRDNILMTIPSKTFEELNSSEGKTALRDELITGLNALIEKDCIKNIYFTEFVIQ
jgi:flagellar FliL protein